MENRVEKEIIEFNNPRDILGMGIKNILQYRKTDPKFLNLIKDWNKTIIIGFKDIYDVTVIFKGMNIHINYGSTQDYDLWLEIGSIQTMTDLAKGDLGPISGFLTGKIKVKKIWNILVLLHFIRIFIPNLRMAGDVGELRQKGIGRRNEVGA
ncbi:MAG: hypothetical protein GF364_21870 [Candidatus Lokiarchaeota archaeon]|nr:hypothetical protein [Candidatus Lokiarchaeota archaeon]